MIIETIKNTHNSKIYKSMVVDKNSTPEQLSQKLYESSSEEELI